MLCINDMLTFVLAAALSSYRYPCSVSGASQLIIGASSFALFVSFLLPRKIQGQNIRKGKKVEESKS